MLREEKDITRSDIFVHNGLADKNTKENTNKDALGARKFKYADNSYAALLIMPRTQTNKEEGFSTDRTNLLLGQKVNFRKKSRTLERQDVLEAFAGSELLENRITREGTNDISIMHADLGKEREYLSHFGLLSDCNQML